MTGASPERDHVVLFSTADWDNPFWTNKQHVAAVLEGLGHRVLYVDSVGLRRPAMTGSDMRRAARRVWKALRGPRRVRPRLWVWSPVCVPLQGSDLVRAMNRRMLDAMLGRHMRRVGMRGDILWTYNPLSTRLLDLSRFRTIVYHCVDDIAAQPGMPAAIIEEAEVELFEAATIVFATSPKLAERARAHSANVHYLPNVADFGHFSLALDPATPVPADLDAIPRPRLGFVGAIARYKMDFDLVLEVARRRPDWSIVLIGKAGEGDPWTDTRPLAEAPNVHLMGPRPYGELPGYLKGMDVAILPSAVNAYTEAMFPMKFFEYLAAGRPVVGVELPALLPFRGVVALARSADDFVAAVEGALADPERELDERLRVARMHTYEARTKAMLALIDGKPAEAGVPAGEIQAEASLVPGRLFEAR